MKFVVEVNMRVLVSRTVEVEVEPDEDGEVDELIVEEEALDKASMGKRKDWDEHSCWEDGEHHVTELKAGHSWCSSRHSILDAQGNAVNMDEEYPNHGF